MPGKFWTESWSPIIGCDPDQPCAERCWALKVVNRMASVYNSGHSPGALQKIRIAMDYNDDGDCWSGYHVLVEPWLIRPLRWRKPRVVATGWFGDMWGGPSDDDFDMRDRVCAMAFREECDRHQFLHLSKQTAYMADHLSYYVRPMRDGYPSNQWWGATVANQADAMERIPHLLRIPGRRWLCVEPVLGPVDLEHAFCIFDGAGEPCGPRCDAYGSSAIKWVVVGAETGPRARPARPEWIQDIIGQCREAGVPVWTKALPPGVQPVRQAPAPIARILRADRKIVAEAESLGVEIEEV